MTKKTDALKITVCDQCYCASCFQGIFYCDRAWEPTTGIG